MVGRNTLFQFSAWALLALLLGCPAEKEEAKPLDLGVAQHGKYLGPCLEDDECNKDLFCVANVCRKHDHQPNTAQDLEPRNFQMPDAGVASPQLADAGPNDTDSGVTPTEPLENTDGGTGSDNNAPADAGSALIPCITDEIDLCDDGNPCNGIETCDPRLQICISAPSINCDDQDLCNGIETCNPETGLCENGTPITCPEIDACEGVYICHAPTGACLLSEPMYCNDHNPCNGTETCDRDSWTCISGTPINYTDDNECNGKESCNIFTGERSEGLHKVCDSSPCDNTMFCRPSDGECISAGGNEIDCDDGSPCNGLETCAPLTGNCLSGNPINCDDNDDCNGTETCNNDTSACDSDNALVCEDDNACNGSSTCDRDLGACVNGPPVSCNDNSACTQDQCDPLTGACHHELLQCGDGDPCTLDFCNEGFCQQENDFDSGPCLNNPGGSP